MSFPLPSHLQVTNQKNREEIELQILSLLRELYCVSGGDLACDRSKFNPGLTDLTSLNNLIFYGLVCGVQMPTAQQFGTCDPFGLQKVLSRSRIFVKVTNLNQIRSATLKDVQEWGSNLNKSLSIAFPDLIWNCNSIQWNDADKQRRVFHHKCWMNELECQQLRDIQVFQSVISSQRPTIPILMNAVHILTMSSRLWAILRTTFFYFLYGVLTVTVQPFGHSTCGRYQKMASGCIEGWSTTFILEKRLLRLC